MIDDTVKKFVPYSGKCEYSLEYMTKNKDKP